MTQENELKIAKDHGFTEQDVREIAAQPAQPEPQQAFSVSECLEGGKQIISELVEDSEGYVRTPKSLILKPIVAAIHANEKADAELAALWRSEHDPRPFALELETLKQQNAELVKKLAELGYVEG